MKAVAILLALLVVPAAGASLRRRDQADPAKPADIKEKWEKLDEFLGVMFTMACKWKNGKDVAGKAKEMLKNGEVDGADGYAAYVKDMQAGNVKGLKKACGMIVAEHEKDCRDGCAANWNAVTEKRDECDEKCVKLYADFESQCMSKADSLTKVYAQKSAKAAGQKQCYEGHCKAFPMVWMKAEESEMQSEVKTQCDTRCTEKAIKAQCGKKWAVEIDFITAKVNSECAEASGISKCFDKKKGDATTAYDKCGSDTKKSCGTDYDDCTKKGNTDKNFKDAKGFCVDRKKMCLEQSDKKCLAENQDALDKAESDCEADASDELTKCQDDKLKAAEGDAETKCVADRTPTCKKDCADTCQYKKMNKCLLVLSNKDDPGKMFCTDFWNLLHRTGEIDPVTGNPVV